MSVESIVNIITSIIVCVATVVSVVIAVIAIKQAKIQMELSNKNNLFSNRVKGYLIIKGLLNLYNQNKKDIEKGKEDKIYFEVDCLFYGLINNSYLENMGTVIEEPLHNPEHKNFLTLLEKLKNEAEKMRFLFENKIGIYARSFILKYAEVLMKLYQYKILIIKMREYSTTYPMVDIKKAAEDMNEIENRKELFKAFEKLSEEYKLLNNYDFETKIIEEIKLN